MPSSNHEECIWGSRRVYIMVLISQSIGSISFTSLANAAIAQGVIGYMVSIVLTYCLIGIPLLYMEFIIGQFTARNCLDVWKIRACLSHIGYAQIFWQIFLVIYNHIITSFVIHYFLISFEDPIPYYICGSWSTKNCNIEKYNYTVNEDCIKLKEAFSHCENLYTTYAEYEYWRYNMLGSKINKYYIAWRVCLASGLACVLIYLSCFRKKESLKWFIYIFVFYPIFGYFILLIGSMMQKGIVAQFEEASDANLSNFLVKYKISDIVLQVIIMLNIGTGISINLGSSSAFRTPCYSNVVIAVVVCAAFTALTVSVTTMMTCPYAFEYNMNPSALMNVQTSFIFEKAPRLLKEYENPSLYLITFFSCNAILGLSTTVIIVFNLLITLGHKYRVVQNYTGLITFAITLIIFFFSITFFNKEALYGIFYFKRYVYFINIFLAILECLVFVIWYGLDKFAEDVHFMHGIRPKVYMRLVWVMSSVLLGYVLACELYHGNITANAGETAGWWTLLTTISLIVLVTFLKLVIAVYKKNISDVIKMDPMWGPRSELLLRSRAMFSAHAMTKEYMYRQYHLQAGIQARQHASNVRRETN